jgi:hypothetical protein
MATPGSVTAYPVVYDAASAIDWHVGSRPAS